MSNIEKKAKKRFIAGASCPKCQAPDALRWWIENNIEMVECVECQHVDQRKPKSVDSSEHASQEMIGIFKPE
ncbi:DNA-binding protein [Vibrio genomosp. F10]|uniref:DNA-binding protein n=2 Tax=Vibrio genomosp. F10 TaxID=723171 RepID=A0A1B9R378_9VIBR|nr:DNA-binding protein [Vibrio genomosp. F10]OEE37583.1 DNA-binding protein [Vibrio genomosp. F10 str. ZF-129]OEE92366.1 DNA-binding protein [Vibrio genomosp. F10 str. 9ZD137]OEE94688.1 DNA-binding protein [Vibrio genomosp. F10 str. 9ZC157]OEF05254.1 DNA-binding protein [Vibrio genomosp. F10 str. 9ZB36]